MNPSVIRTLAVLGVLAISVSAAPAAVRFYFTSSADPAGLTDPSLAFKDTGGNGTDETDYALNGELPSVSAPTIDARKGEFLYLWVAFENEPSDVRIKGIHFGIDGDSAESDRGVYLGDNSLHGGPVRWNLGSQTNDPMVLAAIQEPGIRNSDPDAWLYYGGDTRTALLGAIAFEAKSPLEIRLGIEYPGVFYDRQASPIIKLGGNEEQIEGGIDNQWIWSTDADAYVIPEPGMLTLLLIAAGAVRRPR